MMPLVHAFVSFVSVHQTLSIAALGAVLSLIMSLMTKWLATSPRFAAGYALLVRFFPNLSEPDKLAADIVALITGKPAPEPAPDPAPLKPYFPFGGGDK